MNFQPKNFKYRKLQKGPLPNKVLSSCRKCQNGSFYLKACEFGILNSKEIDSARKVILKKLKKRGKLWLRIFPNHPVTRKPVEVRMGKGKGGLDHWVCKVRPGVILYEIEGVSPKVAEEIFLQTSKKISIRTKFFLS